MPKYLFVGNRRFVLAAMWDLGLDVEIVAVSGSHLERELDGGSRLHGVVDSKSELIDKIRASDADVFVSNGCPFILPIADLPRRTYVNVHPSVLPSLRGADPVPGSILLDAPLGATCHLMDAGIDTGPIISQVLVGPAADIDVKLAYQLSFIAEKDVFLKAYHRGFQPSDPSDLIPVEPSYYTKRDSDQCLDLSEPIEAIHRAVRAFSNRSQGCSLSLGQRRFIVYGSENVDLPFLVNHFREAPVPSVLLEYEDTLIIRHRDGILKLEGVQETTR